MGPRTLEALEAELHQLTEQLKAADVHSGFHLSGTQRAVLHFRIQMLQAMLGEMETGDRSTTKH